MTDEPVRINHLLPAVCLSFVALAIGAVGYMRAPESGEMAVIFPPWVESNVIVQSIVKSGAHLVSPAKFSNIFVIRVDNVHIKERLLANGAMIFTTATGICGPAVNAFNKEQKNEY